jgi:hypothetical protein
LTKDFVKKLLGVCDWPTQLDAPHFNIPFDFDSTLISKLDTSLRNEKAKESTNSAVENDEAVCRTTDGARRTLDSQGV